MSDFIFNHYIGFSWLVTSLGFFTLLLGMFFSASENKLKQAAQAGLVYIALIALGMFADIKHLSFLGIAHTFIAFAIAFYVTKYFNNKFAYCLWIPCLLMVIVIVFNAFNHNIGLELLGRWSRL